jgi:hypothetical protein
MFFEHGFCGRSRLNAQLATKIVFWHDGTRGEIRMGLPEQFPAPAGFEKIVCNTMHEAEVWSERMRKWEAYKYQMEDEQREMIEGPIRANLRSYMRHQMANARNNLNRDFLRQHLESYGNRPDKTKMRRESYLHAEAYEKGR